MANSAKILSFSDVKSENGILSFSIKPLDVVRQSEMLLVQDLPAQASTKNVRMYPGCWYTDAEGLLKAHVSPEEL